ncbi:MAG: Uma2 family endonuclease [Dehalococcoidia bacterium]
MPVSARTYERVALEDGDHVWELVCGRLRQKPAMTTEHNHAARMLAMVIGRQLDPREHVVGTEATRLRVASGSHYVPDVCVVPMALVRRLAARPGTFEVYDDPMPLVVEVWSPSTGDYDVSDKLPEYRRRGDAEIWLLHPYARRLTVWRRQADGTYTETTHAEGEVRLAALPHVTVRLTDLFL